jgi:glutathione synthase
MKKRLGVIMDPIAHITIKKDTTFALLLEAQHQGWSIDYMEMADLFLVQNVPYARMRRLTVQDNPAHAFQFTQTQTERLDSLSLILMRKDPPLDAQYLYTTQLLDRARASGVLVVNRPQSLRDFNEKLFALEFPQCCPPTLVTASITAGRAFLEQHQDIIAKPLHGMGGFSIFRLRHGDPNINVVFETLSNQNQHFMLLQRYIPEITAGDKRILLINGQAVDYALARHAAPGETRANLAAGGTGQVIPLSKSDRWICEQIGPTLQEKGLYFVGLDVIGDYLTEINITSPTGLREIEAVAPYSVAELFFKKLPEFNSS